jgi:hypothetical protein
MTPGMKLEWGPKEIEDLRELVEHLKSAIQGAPCLVAFPGEATYECRHDSPCRVCRWRQEVSRELAEEWGLLDGIW